MRKAKIINRNGNYDTIETYDINDFPYEKLNTMRLNCRGKKPKQYIYDFATFDIESSTVDSDKPFAFMYHWQMDVGSYVITGRYWWQWLYFMDKITSIYEIDKDCHFAIYVHNLGYEFQFMRDYILNQWGEFEIFATKRRAPIRITTQNGFEFRCSYKLTNMTLSAATFNEVGVKHIKAVGDLDYKILRTADTPLDDIEFGYCVSDVVSLYEMIKARLKNEHDNIETIPMTSTGYVRRDCRKACRKDANYRKLFKKCTMTSYVYTLLKEASRGGNTHANRNMSGRVWSLVDSFDFVSDYPAQIMLRKFPMSKFVPYGEIESISELDRLLNKYACLFRITLTNVKLKEHIAMPYIPISKCTRYARRVEDIDVELRLDNGRVLSAPVLSMTLTDIDFSILKRQYNWDDIAVSDMCIAEYDILPQPIRDVVMEYFKKKTELKAAIEEEEEKEEPDIKKLDNLKYLYGKAKNRLNGIFGMLFTDVCYTRTFIDENGEWKEEAPDVAEALDKFYKSRNSFHYYAWGVWVTCWARLNLENLIELTGHDKTIYCDTDSSKAVGVDIAKIKEFNDKIIALADKRGAYYDFRGKRYYLGIAERENKKPIAKFKTLGAKKYAYHDEKGFHITISGVSKAKNNDTGEYIAVEEMRCIKHFTNGFIFKKAGGNELVYNDKISIHDIKINGCTMSSASNVAILDSTYTVGITGEYAELIGYNIYTDIEKM